MWPLCPTDKTILEGTKKIEIQNFGRKKWFFSKIDFQNALRVGFGHTFFSRSLGLFGVLENFWIFFIQGVFQLFFVSLGEIDGFLAEPIENAENASFDDFRRKYSHPSEKMAPDVSKTRKYGIKPAQQSAKI